MRETKLKIAERRAQSGRTEIAPGTTCRLTLVARTERGYPRRELASFPGATWKMIAPAVQKVLVRGMDPVEQGPNPAARSTPKRLPLEAK